MDRRLDKISDKVDESAGSFVTYFQDVAGEEIFSLVSDLARKTRLLVFSGIIRNFFLNDNEARDIDIVIGDRVAIEELFPSAEVRANSFGGYKVVYPFISIDIWHIEDTWAYQFQKVFDFYYTVGIPSTAFFNFSSVAFDFNLRQFLYTKSFLKFLREKELDFVYKPNPNYDLCVVNTLYYRRKYKLRVSKRLSEFIVFLHRASDHDYVGTQIKHFGKIQYDDQAIDSFVEELESTCCR